MPDTHLYEGEQNTHTTFPLIKLFLVDRLTINSKYNQVIIFISKTKSKQTSRIMDREGIHSERAVGRHYILENAIKEHLMLTYLGDKIFYTYLL